MHERAILASEPIRHGGGAVEAFAIRGDGARGWIGGVAGTRLRPALAAARAPRGAHVGPGGGVAVTFDLEGPRAAIAPGGGVAGTRRPGPRGVLASLAPASETPERAPDGGATATSGTREGPISGFMRRRHAPERGHDTGHIHESEAERGHATGPGRGRMIEGMGHSTTAGE